MNNIIKLVEAIDDNYCFEIDDNIEEELLLFLSGLLKDRFFRVIEKGHGKFTALELMGVGYIRILSNIFIYKGNEKEGLFCNDIIINADEIDNETGCRLCILRNRKIIYKELSSMYTNNKRIFNNKIVINGGFI